MEEQNHSIKPIGKRQPVNSRLITSLLYDADAKTLEVEYKAGSMYRYYNIEKTFYQDMLASEHPGHKLTKYLKANRVKSKKIG